MNLKKILNVLIFLIFLLNTTCCLATSSHADIEAQKKATRAKINRLKFLENLESNKLYKNQQRLEYANNELTNSKTKIVSAQKELYTLESQLEKVSNEYNALNYQLSYHLRAAYKSNVQRKTFFEIILNSEDVNTFIDRLYYQQIIVKSDYNKMVSARTKAREIRAIRDNIALKKHNLERSVASINSQQQYINRAIEKNKDMIDKLRNDRVAYQKAERELAKQSASIGSYINKTAKDTNVQVASGFIKPIQGRITSPFGWRTHPIFNSRSFHSGVDIGGPNYGEIKASNTGKVIYCGWYGGYGKVVILEHGIVNGKPITTLYAHMSSIKVANGQKVTKGQVLGYEGTTGYSTGPHCHFEVRVNGQPNNPLNYI